jgi:carbamoyl-phosphate synthase large subunit
MAIGRTFQESLQKALRGLETGLTGLDEIEIEGLGRSDDKNAIRAALGTPTPDRLLQVAQAMRLGWSNEESSPPARSIRGFWLKCAASSRWRARSRAAACPPTRSACGP